MKIEQEIIHKLLYDIEGFGISREDYETEYYKEFAKKHSSYREMFSSLLSPELQKVYDSVCDMEDYMGSNEFDIGKIVGFTIAMGLIKALDKPLKAHSDLTATFIPIKEAYKIDDVFFNKAITEYKEKRGTTKCNS